MSNMAGPFGDPRRQAANGVVDLGQVAAQQAAQEEIAQQLASGQIQVPLQFMPFIQLGERMLNELAGIRIAMMPEEETHHLPCIMPVSDDKGKMVCYQVFCLSCSNAQGRMVYPCEAQDEGVVAHWPPSALVPANFAKPAERVAQEKLLAAAAAAATQEQSPGGE